MAAQAVIDGEYKPEALPNLSGEWADDLTGPALFELVMGKELDGSDDQEGFNEICLAWEEGCREGYSDTLEESAAAFLEALEEEEAAPEKIALARQLGCKLSEIEERSWDHYGLKMYEAEGKDWAVGTDEEADEACKQYIEQSVWAFKASFILSHCELPCELEDAIEAFQQEKCEGANDAILALIDKCGSLDDFTQEAIRADGRGHFLSSYDGEEQEEEVNGTLYFIYKN